MDDANLVSRLVARSYLPRGGKVSGGRKVGPFTQSYIMSDGHHR